MSDNGVSRPTVIKLKGRATIHKITAVQKCFHQALERRQPIHIDVEGVTEVDLSFVQVLISMAYSCSQKPVDLVVIKTDESHPLSVYVKKMGFKNLKFLESEAS